MTAPSAGKSKLKAFISYSRADMAFVDKLESALRNSEIEPLIDRREIFAFEDWWKRIESLIRQAHTVVFLISPDSIQSDVCIKEIAFATSLNKMFAPIICRTVDIDKIPSELSRFNFIFFEDNQRFDENFEVLRQALTTNIDWVRSHTELSQSATNWEQSKRLSGLLLRSPLLDSAEGWLASRPEGAPEPTPGTLDFIVASRRAATRRRNILTGGLAIGLLLALGLASLAYWQRGIALEQQAQAQSQRSLAQEQSGLALEQRNRALVNEARYLADQSEKMRERGDALKGVLLALEGISDPDATTQRPLVPEAIAQLRQASRVNRELSVLSWYRPIVPRYGTRFVYPISIRNWPMSSQHHWLVFDALSGRPICFLHSIDRAVEPILGNDGSWIAYTPSDHAIVVSSTNDCSAIRNVELPTNLPAARLKAINPDASIAVVASGDNRLQVWDTRSSTMLSEFRHPLGGFGKVAVNHDGTRIATGHWKGDRNGDYSGRAVLLDRTGKIIKDLEGRHGTVLLLEFSPDGTRLASATTGTAACCGDEFEVPLWDGMSGELIRVIDDGQTRSMGAIAFSPDSRWFITASNDGSAQLRNARDGTPVGPRIHETNSGMRAAIFSPDGLKFAVSSTLGTVWIRDVRGERLGAVIRPSAIDRRQDIDRLSFVGTSDLLITAGFDGPLRLWDARLGSITTHVVGDSAGVVERDWSRPPFQDSSVEASFGRMRMAPNETKQGRDAVIASARASVPRCLTEDERAGLNLPGMLPSWCAEKWPSKTAYSEFLEILKLLEEGKEIEAAALLEKVAAKVPTLSNVIRSLNAVITIEKGREAFRAGRPDEAAAEFEAVSKIDSRLESLLKKSLDRLGLELARRNRGVELLEAYVKTHPNELSALKGEIAEAYNTLGIDSAQQKQYERAVEHYSKGLSYDFSNGWLYANRGLARQVLGDSAGAISDFDKAIENGPFESEFYNFRARAIAQVDPRKAVDDYSSAIALLPPDKGQYTNNNDSSILFNRALLYFELGEFQHAAIDFDRAVRLSQSDMYGLLLQHAASRRAGAEGKSELEALAKRSKVVNWPRAIVELYLGRISETDLLSWSKKPENVCEAHFYIGQLRLANDSPHCAADQFRIAAETCPKTFIESKLSDIELSRVGLASLFDASKCAPIQATAEPLSLSCDSLAASTFDETRPAHVEGVNIENLDPEQAVPACERALDRAPNDARIRYQLARALEKAKLDPARVATLYAEAANQGSAVAMFNLGGLYFSGEGLERNERLAVEWYVKSAEAGLHLAMNYLATLYESGEDVAQDLAKAVEWYEKAVKAGNVTAMRNLSKLYLDGKGVKQNHNKAIELLEKAVAAGDQEASELLETLEGDGANDR